MIKIYCITFAKTGLHYIGKSKNYKRRKKQHISMLNNGNHHSLKFQMDYDHYNGKTSDLFFEVIDECIPDLADVFETYYINNYRSYISGYNMNRGEAWPPVDDLEAVRNGMLIDDNKIVCRNCGKPFVYDTNEQYCSSFCYQAASIKRRPISSSTIFRSCDYCKREYVYTVQNPVFCSSICKSLSKKDEWARNLNPVDNNKGYGNEKKKSVSLLSTWLSRRSWG